MNHAGNLTPLSGEKRALFSPSGVYRSLKKTCPTMIKKPYRWARERAALARLKSASITKPDFVKDIGCALADRRGYAAAKIGISQKYWMYYEIFLSQKRDLDEVEKYEKELKFHALRQEGIFPESCAFYLEFNRFYMEHAKNLDCLGVVYRPALMERQLITHYELKSRLIHYPLQEPGTTDDECYLPHFTGKKLLLVCPFASLLKERATQRTFEGVWSKFGKKWFHPASVDMVEFPYGFAKATHQIYPTVMELFDSIMKDIHQKDFDVALVAAGGLSIPIVSSIKNSGKVAIDVGGHLQIVFGVIGQRWRNWEDMKNNYFNEFWIDMPEKYKPKETDVCDLGAYW